MSRVAIVAPTSEFAPDTDAAVARWGDQLRSLGHSVDIVTALSADTARTEGSSAALETAEVLITLHAGASVETMEWWRSRRPGKPIVVQVSEIDLARHLPSNRAAMAVVDAADALIVSRQAAGDRLYALDAKWANKTHLIHPSSEGPTPVRTPPFDEFRVVVLADLHLNNDPLLTARAASLLPPTSRIAVHHGGQATDDEWLLQAAAESSSNERYIWHGELNRPAGLALLASAHLVACSSALDGQAAVITDAIAIGVPIICARNQRTIDLLGADHPGLFAAGDHLALSNLLDWLELSPNALGRLAQYSQGRRHLTDPARESDALGRLISILVRD